MPRRTAMLLVPVLLLTLTMAVTSRRADTLPAGLTDREYWSLIEQLSEPDGYFVSRSGSPDNLLSNEMEVSTVAAALARRVPAGGVYLGVGPEQNFTYIAAIRPRIAFITDIRRGNCRRASPLQGALRDVSQPRRVRRPAVQSYVRAVAAADVHRGAAHDRLHQRQSRP